MRTRVRAESWPIAGGFRIARGSRENAQVIVLEVESGGHIGRGECVPYPRYGESLASVTEQIESWASVSTEPPPRASLAELSPGAARNAIDCALWDLEAKGTGDAVWARFGHRVAPEVTTMRTVSVDTPDAMVEAARALSHAKALKVKVDGGPDLERIEAVHETVPHTRLIVDANESWSEAQLTEWLPLLPGLGVRVLEQPLPASSDAALASLRGTVPFCADESFHDRRSLDDVEGRYDIVNVKLDKAGGLTEAWAAQTEAHARGFESMVGCMVSTSLAIAPALILASRAAYVDLDGPFLLERDRAGATHDEVNSALRSSATVWGA